MSIGGRAVERAEAAVLVGALRAATDGATWVAAGSYRRGQPVVRDLDVVVAAGSVRGVQDGLRRVCDALLRRRDGEILGGLCQGVRIELYVAKEDALGAMLLHATGSKAFNIWCRGLALRRGWKLNQYGLFEVKSGERLAAKTEREILERLGTGWVEPERREGGPWRSSTES